MDPLGSTGLERDRFLYSRSCLMHSRSSLFMNTAHSTIGGSDAEGLETDVSLERAEDALASKEMSTESSIHFESCVDRVVELKTKGRQRDVTAPTFQAGDDGGCGQTHGYCIERRTGNVAQKSITFTRTLCTLLCCNSSLAGYAEGVEEELASHAQLCRSALRSSGGGGVGRVEGGGGGG